MARLAQGTRVASNVRVEKRLAGVVLGLALCLIPAHAHAYGVLAHLALVDAAWDDTLEPALRARFPGVTEEELRRAHAFAYGGALIHDIGYYPGGSRELSDLLHYVRSGDFVIALAEEATDLADYAFAFGALAHYLGDGQGHPLGVNRVVALSFPKLRKRHGDSVTYIQGTKEHLRVEFGFDVVQVARGLYPPEAYRKFIGFEVPLRLLDRAMRRTYGIELAEILPRPERSVRSLRHFAATLFPKATRVAWAAKKSEIEKLLPEATNQTFVYNMNNAAFEKEWGKEYDRPGFLSRLGAFFLKLLPKIGPLKLLVPKPPTAEGERIYEESVNVVLDTYRAAIRGETAPVRNANLDVGEPVPVGGYARADKAWLNLCARLDAGGNRTVVAPGLAEAIQAHFDGMDSPCRVGLTE